MGCRDAGVLLQQTRIILYYAQYLLARDTLHYLDILDGGRLAITVLIENLKLKENI